MERVADSKSDIRFHLFSRYFSRIPRKSRRGPSIFDRPRIFVGFQSMQHAERRISDVGFR